MRLWRVTPWLVLGLPHGHEGLLELSVPQTLTLILPPFPCPGAAGGRPGWRGGPPSAAVPGDRKSTRLNSSH